MDLKQLNKAIAECNPYDQKELRAYLVGLRRKLEREEAAKADAGELPVMLQKQCGL